MFTCLLLNGSRNGASASASAALNTFISVDNVFSVAFADTFYGALINASAASNAFVSDYVCHFIHLQNSLLVNFNIYIEKINR